MTIKTYSDGSELTPTLLIGAVVGAALLGTGIFLMNEKVSKFRTKRIMKKYGWPEKSYK